MTRCLLDDGPLDAAMLRRWAFDPDAVLLDQDEDLVLGDFAFVPLLLELAADPACPKADEILSALDYFFGASILHQRADDRDAIVEAIRAASRHEGCARVAGWRAVQLRRLECLTIGRPVTTADALQMGTTLLNGLSRRCRISVRLETPAAIELELTVPQGLHREWLRIDRTTGRFRYARYWIEGTAEPAWIAPSR